MLTLGYPHSKFLKEISQKGLQDSNNSLKNESEENNKAVFNGESSSYTISKEDDPASRISLTDGKTDIQLNTLEKSLLSRVCSGVFKTRKFLEKALCYTTIAVVGIGFIGYGISHAVQNQNDNIDNTSNINTTGNINTSISNSILLPSNSTYIETEYSFNRN